ncbi:hypothetical protein LINPERHAP1_LOCUS13887 [Linum perenne]
MPLIPRRSCHGNRHPDGDDHHACGRPLEKLLAMVVSRRSVAGRLPENI